jgi:hypothetical protein
MLSAVASGAYNAGIEGAFNQQVSKVSKTLVDEVMASEPPDSRYSNAPSHQLSAEPPPPKPKSRIPAVLAVVGALAVITAGVIIAWWHFV